MSVSKCGQDGEDEDEEKEKGSGEKIFAISGCSRENDATHTYLGSTCRKSFIFFVNLVI